MIEISVIVFLISAMIWVGVGTVWILKKPKKNQKSPFIFDWTMIPEIMFFPTLAFLGFGLITFCFAFLVCPNEIREYSGSVCEVVEVDKFRTAAKFAVIIGLASEYIISLYLSFKYFVKK